MGVEVEFQPGPTIGDPIRSLAQVEKLRVPDPQESTPFVFEILRELRSELATPRIPLLGFAGAPFTLAAYLVEGKGSKDFGALKRMMVRRARGAARAACEIGRPDGRRLSERPDRGRRPGRPAVRHLGRVARARRVSGVGAAGPFIEIAARLDRDRAPLILYVNNGAHVFDETLESGADVLSLDWRVTMSPKPRAARVIA